MNFARFEGVFRGRSGGECQQGVESAALLAALDCVRPIGGVFFVGGYGVRAFAVFARVRGGAMLNGVSRGEEGRAAIVW